MEEIINMKKENSTEKLLTGNIVSTMISLSLPAIIGMVVIGLYNFMDAVLNIILDPILINIMNSSGEGVKGAACYICDEESEKSC